ncbi:unnamed protein product [Soboliphyme baturini]|uniref:Protein of centriole 5 n=1 Tax=Soboliphyme baturini TaxID=241478 RepID=A0A183ILM1_9BILA|nr:unnamed protein product [Soboliphyme baturini]
MTIIKVITVLICVLATSRPNTGTAGSSSISTSHVTNNDGQKTESEFTDIPVDSAVQAQSNSKASVGASDNGEFQASNVASSWSTEEKIFGHEVVRGAQKLSLPKADASSDVKRWLQIRMASMKAYFEANVALIHAEKRMLLKSHSVEKIKQLEAKEKSLTEWHTGMMNSSESSGSVSEEARGKQAKKLLNARRQIEKEAKVVRNLEREALKTWLVPLGSMKTSSSASSSIATNSGDASQRAVGTSSNIQTMAPLGMSNAADVPPVSDLVDDRNSLSLSMKQTSGDIKSSNVAVSFHDIDWKPAEQTRHGTGLFPSGQGISSTTMRALSSAPFAEISAVSQIANADVALPNGHPTHSGVFDENDRLTDELTLFSGMNEYQSRIMALKDDLMTKKAAAQQLSAEYNRRTKQQMRVHERSLKQQIEVYERHIRRLEEHISELSTSKAKAYADSVSPKILSPRPNDDDVIPKSPRSLMLFKSTLVDNLSAYYTIKEKDRKAKSSLLSLEEVSTGAIELSKSAAVSRSLINLPPEKEMATLSRDISGNVPSTEKPKDRSSEQLSENSIEEGFLSKVPPIDLAGLVESDNDFVAKEQLGISIFSSMLSQLITDIVETTVISAHTATGVTELSSREEEVATLICDTIFQSVLSDSVASCVLTMTGDAKKDKLVPALDTSMKTGNANQRAVDDASKFFEGGELTTEKDYEANLPDGGDVTSETLGMDRLLDKAYPAFPVYEQEMVENAVSSAVEALFDEHYDVSKINGALATRNLRMTADRSVVFDSEDHRESNFENFIFNLCAEILAEVYSFARQWKSLSERPLSRRTRLKLSKFCTIPPTTLQQTKELVLKHVRQYFGFVPVQPARIEGEKGVSVHCFSRFFLPMLKKVESVIFESFEFDQFEVLLCCFHVKYSASLPQQSPFLKVNWTHTHSATLHLMCL